MLNEKDLNYFNSGNYENKKFWKRLGGKPNFVNKSVLDFGCGHGSLCMNVANSGASSVTGIDLNEKLINFANENLNTNFKEFSERVFFKKKDLFDNTFDKKFDFIVSKDTFEHTLDLEKVLNRFYDLLKKDGKAYIGFGPLYNSFNGDHGRTQLKLPWLHVILTDQFIIKRYNKNNIKTINSIEDLGLNKYSYQKYKKILNDSNFEIEYFKNNQSDNPVAKIFNLISKIKFLKEYFKFNIYCILKKS